MFYKYTLLVILNAGIAGATGLDSLNFRNVSSWPFSSTTAVAEDTSRGLLFVASGGGVLIFDESPQDTFLLVSNKLRTSGDFIRSIAYDEDNQTLFTAHGAAHIEVWSVEDPLNPYLLSTFQDTFTNRSPVNKLILHGDYLFANFGNSSANYILIFDKNNLPNFEPVATINIPHDTTDMAIEDTVLFVSAEPYIRIYSISDPLNPYIIGNYYLGWGDYILEASNNLLFRGLSRTYLYIDDITDPANPAQLVRISINPTEIRKIKRAGDTLFVAGTALMSLDISNPSSPETLWILQSTGGGVYKDLIIHSDRIISSIGWRGICSIKMDESGSPYETDHFQTPAMGISISHDESYLYFTTYNVTKTFLHTLAYSNGELREVSRFEFEGIPYTDMCVQNNLVYLFINDTLKIVDVSDPENPFLRSNFSFGHPPRERHFIVENNILYATDSTNGLYIASVENPDSPYVISHVSDTVEFTTNSFFVDTQSGYAYLTGWYYLHIINISDVNSPVVENIISINGASFIAAIRKVENYLYLFNQDSTLFLLDISNPSQPIIDTVIYLPSYTVYTKSVDIDGDILVARTNKGWIYSLDISNPRNPVISGYYRAPIAYTDASSRIMISGNMIASTYTNRGIQFYETTPTRIAERGSDNLSSCTKIVTNGTIWFNAVNTSPVVLKVYDTSGRLRAFKRKIPTATKITFNLNGLPAGTYFYVLKTQTRNSVGKFVKVQ